MGLVQHVLIGPFYTQGAVSSPQHDSQPLLNMPCCGGMCAMSFLVHQCHNCKQACLCFATRKFSSIIWLIGEWLVIAIRLRLQWVQTFSQMGLLLGFAS